MKGKAAMRLDDDIIDEAQEKRLVEQAKEALKSGDVNLTEIVDTFPDDVLKPIEFGVYVALLNSRDFADAVTERQLNERAKRISNYVPYIVARARALGWVK